MPQPDEPAMPAAYAADVPLICDPVPGPPAFITTSRALSPVQVEQLRRALRKGAISPNYARAVVFDNVRFERAIGARTEWPDAAFCAA